MILELAARPGGWMVFGFSASRGRETGDSPEPENGVSELILAAKNGGEDACAELIRRFQPAVAARMWRFTRDPAEHRELVHDVFVEAFTSLHRYRCRAPFLHWLSVVATRTGYRFWRERAKTKRHEPLDVIENLPAEDAGGIEPEEAARLLFSLLALLPPADRLILTLHYFEDLTMEEIAAQTGWSKTYVKVRAHRARRRLRDGMVRRGYGDAP